jgi:hypothetical protein
LVANASEGLVEKMRAFVTTHRTFRLSRAVSSLNRQEAHRVPHNIFITNRRVAITMTQAALALEHARPVSIIVWIV